MAILRLASIGVLICVALLAGLFLSLARGPRLRALSDRARVWFCRLACRALGIIVESEGPPPADSPCLLVSNHVSWTDVLALGSVRPMVFLARHDLAGWPLLGPLARVHGTLFVERGRRRQIPEVNRQIAAEMSRGSIAVLFPEATTGDGTRLRKFHSPHFEAPRSLLGNSAGTPTVLIAPVALAYTRRGGLPLGRTGRAAVAWYGDTEFAPHLLDLVRDGRVTCRIKFLKPIPVEQSANRKALAREAARRIAVGFRGEIMADPRREDATSYVHRPRQVV